VLYVFVLEPSCKNHEITAGTSRALVGNRSTEVRNKEAPIKRARTEKEGENKDKGWRETAILDKTKDEARNN